MKSIRTVRREEINPVNYAYMKQLKNFNRTKREYAVNPYAEVYQFRSNVYSIFTESLDGMGDPWIHLIVGSEKALLIDNGFGLGNLKGLVDEITGGLPIIPVVTHCHFDHSYGNSQFEEVYCHEYEVPRIKDTMNSHIWDYLFDSQGRGIWADFDREDLVGYHDYHIVGCENGHVFQLGGGCDVELVFLPGHTVGHSGYLDKSNKILFVGDSVCFGGIGIRGPEPGEPYGEYASLTAMTREFKKILERRSEFDSIFPSHGILDMPVSIMEEVCNTCCEIVNNPDCYDIRYEESGGVFNKVRYKKMIPGVGYLRYAGDGI